MLSPADITPWHWAGFIVVVLGFLALDLGVFHRHAHTVSFKEALGWTCVWFCLAVAFSLLLIPVRGRTEALEFATGYIIELSLSMDNVFVIALIFSFFRVPNQYQHRVLFWGIIGALAMRGIMIGVGAALISRFHWLLYVFGAFLIYSGFKMLFVEEDGVHPDKNPVVRLARRLYPVSSTFNGQRFFTEEKGVRMLTPLAIVLVMVETTDLIFALDSIPAIFVVTQDPFIVFTSNVFAILGLRSLYFVLVNAIAYFRYLKIGLSVVLIFIGAKMLLAIRYDISTPIALIVVASIILTSIVFSVLIGRREQHRQDTPPLDPPPPC
jgi:tellurite resistance protein TerC